MTGPFDLGEFKRAAFLPEITLEVFHQLPEDVCMQVEVVDGWMVRCESSRLNDPCGSRPEMSVGRGSMGAWQKSLR